MTRAERRELLRLLAADPTARALARRALAVVAAALGVAALLVATTATGGPC